MSEREKFENYARCEGFDLHQWTEGNYSDSQTSGAWEGWQAALSTRKPYGYGIVDKDGKFAGAYRNLDNANDECDYKNEEVKDIPPLPGYPFRVVELFYEKQS